jgi:3'-phosphoadenosine 5'-phosphosulfate sulfotransferase (PAPS reductase)/FAD synthetase
MGRKYIASCSFGKDSTAMILELIKRGYPLDEVVFYDTGMEFKAIYNMRDRFIPIFKENGIKYTELKPNEPFLYTMLEKPCESKQKGKHLGYGWCGGMSRWGTTKKQIAMDKYAEDRNAMVYIGIAFDEQNRLNKQIKQYKLHPLVDWHMTESDCLQYCYDSGYSWLEGDIDLYDVLDRVSCWCCCNKNMRELRNIWKYLPEYWNKLKYLQSRLERPMKNYHNKKYGKYGNLFELEKVFEIEEGLNNG